MLVPGLDFKSSVERFATFLAGSIPVPRRHLAPSSLHGFRNVPGGFDSRPSPPLHRAHRRAPEPSTRPHESPPTLLETTPHAKNPAETGRLSTRD